MGWPFSLDSRRQPITRQAITRLVISLGLFVIALSYSSALLYRTALSKAAHERAEDLAAFYQFRIAQLDRDWEVQTRDFKARIEFARYLEEPKTAVINLQALFTIQGGERRFLQLLVLDKHEQTRFAISKEGHFSNPLKKEETSGWYRDPDNGKLFRVFLEPIWLGKDGTGKMLTYFPVDNALLYLLASPGVMLTARYQNEQVSSSLGSEGMQHQAMKSDAIERRELHWASEPNDPLTLVIEAPVKGIFSTLELSLGVGLIPLVDALILWFALGTWLMLQARRISALGVAVAEFSRCQEMTQTLHENIRQAQQGNVDEIHDVAVAIEVLAQQTVKQRLQHIREEEKIRLWSSVFKSSAEAIIITDRDCNIVEVNPAFQSRTGYLLQDVLGKNPRILSANLQTPVFYQAMWQEITAKGYWQGEVWDSNKDGTLQPYLMTISSVRDATGEVVNYVGYYTDISARIRSDEELKHHRDHLEELVAERTLALEKANQKLTLQTSKLIAREEDLHRAQAVAKLGSWRLDVGISKLYWSDETYRIFGLPQTEQITYPIFLHAVHVDDRAFVDSKWQAAMQGEPYDIEHRIVVAGDIKWVREQAAMAFDEKGELLGGIGTVHDITEHRQLEAMKSGFVSTVSHELRTPLTAISGSLGLIMGGVLGEPPAAMKQMLDIAHKNSQRLAYLVNDLLDMEKLIAGKMYFDLQTQPLMPLLELSLESIHAYGKQYQVSFLLTERADEVQVLVDSVRLQQVVANFLSNAAKFSPTGGQVEITVRRHNAGVRVEVSDHGSGIPAEFHNRIFQKFSQADTTDTRQKGGTGLGLAISKELIERMGGHIGFVSSPGQGTVFFFELPVA
jgi:PAS domain S-box-containing protein